MVLLFLCVFFTVLWIGQLRYQSEESRLSPEILSSDAFRRQSISKEAMDAIRGMDIIIVTTAETDEEARELLAQMGAPFQR